MSEMMEKTDIATFLESSYLDYAMYVIGDRALPNVADDLKPVHRRLLFAMNELKLNANTKYKKSARTVGDTLGKYHPHGDSACYEAMVGMAQPFTTLVPLIDGQGNWGSPNDPKSFAAMRYTEAKMTAYADSFFEEIKNNTVTFTPNFDGTMKEPTLLPVRVPNILVNGTTGVAVGLATDVPSHNMQEVIDACLVYLKKPTSRDEDILSAITVPDFASGGVVIDSLEDVHAVYAKGRGVINVRADIDVEPWGLHIKSLPPKVSSDKVMEAIDALVKSDKLPITDILDRSTEGTPVSIRIEVKGKDKCDSVLRVLLAKTELEKSEKVNLTLIDLEGKPTLFSLPNIIRQWCQFRQVVFERKKKFRLEQVENRIHILNGLLTAYANLDEVIRIIREEDEPADVLKQTYSLSDEQVKAILELRLRQLAKLEEGALRGELASLEKERGEIVALLADDKKVKRAIMSELRDFAKKMVQPRRTLHVPQEKVTLSAVKSVLEKAYPVTVVLSKMGWVRTLRGHDVDENTLSFKTGDALAKTVKTMSDEPVILMGDQGRFYNLSPASLPGGKSMGEPVSKHCQFQNGEVPLTVMAYEKGKRVLLVNKQGAGFITNMDNLLTRARKGKHVVVCKSDTSLCHPIVIHDDATLLAMTSDEGRLVIIGLDEINESNKSQGVRLMNMGSDPENVVTSLQLMDKQSTFSLMVGKRKFSMTPDKWEKYKTARARRGLYFEGGRKQLSFLE